MKRKILAVAVLSIMLTGCGSTEQNAVSNDAKETSAVSETAASSAESTIKEETTVLSETSVSETVASETTDAETSVSSASESQNTEVPETEADKAEEKDTEEKAAETEVPQTEETLPVTEAEEERFYGVLIDADCSDFEDPPAHDLPCMLMDGCRASGYGIDILKDDGTWVFYMFDQKGQELTLDYLLKTKRMDNLYVYVTGKSEDSVIRVTGLEEAPY